ncbi:hypothetical protein NN3_42040 [Nocardia neocaledoniensis NBRC 108232]|uniref:Putative LppA-like lipoprotein n=1 Tax=Nocardia neocaledoniensis TaxID=236511 RepID=A0A317NUT1_9NOCA|nr:LppA family lipoprotein [Nocardia neocaledoniensis]PWV79136.1 putative LppA-like lipoprotein [Nocardia neocaledoniensis]GEM33197.1 hypothetical protein NN3_42040 [Nocardia neocaledoniensis NBRC 108232]
MGRKGASAAKVLVLTVVIGLGTVVAMWIAVVLVWGWAARDSGESPSAPSPEAVARADAELRTRGSLEEAQAKGETVVAQLQTVMSTLDPSMRFLPSQSARIEDCGGADGAAGGRELKYRSYDGNHRLAQRWPAFRDQAIAAAREIGIELVDRGSTLGPASNQVVLGIPSDGATFTVFNTPVDDPDGGKVVIAMEITCHLPADKLDPSVEPTR